MRLHWSRYVCSIAKSVWLCEPMHCSPPSSSAHGILQARIREWAAISSSRGSSWTRDQTRVSCIAGRFFTISATREADHADQTSKNKYLVPAYEALVPAPTSTSPSWLFFSSLALLLKHSRMSFLKLCSQYFRKSPYCTFTWFGTVVWDFIVCRCKLLFSRERHLQFLQ